MPTSDGARAGCSADASSAGGEGQAALAPWRAVDLDVSAVIGHRGTAAVLRRALVTTRRTHAWLPVPPEDASFDVCMRLLGDALDARGTEDAGAARQALPSAFRDLLASLVGAVLAGQLLGAAWVVRRARDEPEA